MAVPWILESKLERPEPPAGWLRRELLPVLPPAVLLLAGPGYGKTLALVALAEGEGTLWYALDEGDGDRVTFFHYLVAGMRRRIPRFGEDLLALLAGEAPDPRRLWHVFFQAVAAYNLPGLRLILDDAHHLDVDVLKALGYFLERLPANIHVLMAARRRLPLQGAKLELAGKLVVLDQARLAFTPAEEEAVLRARAHGGTIPEAWRRQALELDGWPLGVGQVGNVRGRLADVAREVYEALPPDRQAFMLRAALLPELTPELVEAVFGLADARAGLAALEADQLVQRVGAHYRVPAYLAAFLVAEGRMVLAPAELAGWHLRAAALQRAAARDELALPHLVAAGAWEEAIAACLACFPAMRYGGRLAQIERWLAAFPAAMREAEPHLALWRGHLAYTRGRMPEAQALYEAAQRGFEERDEPAGAFKALVRRCGLAFVRDDLKEAGRLLLQAIARQADGWAEDQVDVALTRGLAADLRGDLALMRECNLAALAVPCDANVEIAASHCNAHMNLYTLALQTGDLREAERHVREAHTLAEAWRFYAYAQAATFLHANLALVEGQLDVAEALVREAPAVWEEVLDWHGRACAHVVLGQVHQARGEWREAEAAFRKAAATFEQAGYKEAVKVPLERLLWLALQRGQLPRVAELLAEAGELGDASAYDLALLVPAGRALHLQGRHAEAIATLERALAGLEALDAGLHAARAGLYLAAARQAAGVPGAVEARAAAERRCDERGYGFLRTQDLALWEELGTPVAGGLELRFLGPFEVRVDGVLVDRWPRKKARLVLAALALYPRGLSTAELLEALGEPEISATAINSWQVVVTALRRTLEPALAKPGASRFVLTQQERYVLAWDQLALFDRARFLELAGTRGPGQAAAFTEAMALYRGHLLEDADAGAAFDADREYLKQLALELLTWLAAHHQERAEEAEAERCLRRAMALAPTDEEPYMAFMRYAGRWGRPELARQAYWDCRKALKARLGTTPSPEFEDAYRALASDAPIKA